MLVKLRCCLFVLCMVAGAAAFAAPDTDLPSFNASESESLSLQTDAGDTVQAYLAGPRGAKWGILLLHGQWGLNDDVRDWADQLSDLGYRVAVVDLFDGAVAQTPEEAQTLIAQLDQKAANAKYHAALKLLAAPGRKLATVGWGFGGSQALHAGAAAPVVAATVLYDAPPVLDVDVLKGLRGPVLGVFNRNGVDVPREQLQAFASSMKRANKTLSLHYYDGDAAPATPYIGRLVPSNWEQARGFLKKYEAEPRTKAKKRYKKKKRRNR
jgi:carboxymethylenebutenolidase